MVAKLPALPEPSPDDPALLQQERAKQGQLKYLLAEIEARIKIEDSPRTRFVPSAAIETEVRKYYQRLQARIESTADDDYPKDSQGPIYGCTRVSFILNAQGRIESVRVLSTTSEMLAAYSAALLRRLEPFDPFPPGVAKRADHIIVSTSFDFAREQP